MAEKFWVEVWENQPRGRSQWTADAKDRKKAEQIKKVATSNRYPKGTTAEIYER